MRSLLAARDGTLWIGTLEGLTRWRDGRLTVLRRGVGYSFDHLAEDGEGTVWAGVRAIGEGGRLCQVRGESLECHGAEGSVGRYLAGRHLERPGRVRGADSN